MRFGLRWHRLGRARRAGGLALRGTDAASLSTAVTVDAFVAGTTTTQETANTVTFDAWAGVASASASGGSYRSANVAGSTASFTFTAAAVDWITATGPEGQAAVTIDGVDKGAYDLYSATTVWQVKKAFSGLGPGSHTIVVKVLGTKNPSSGGTKVIVDGFVAHA